MFLKAKLEDGTEVVSEFTKLTKVQKYINQVFKGEKSFNAWKVAGDTHPDSGEPNRQRQRTLISGRTIVSVEPVVPTTQDHDYQPENFTPALLPSRGPRGFWRIPTQGVVRAGGITAVPGTQYPKHRNPRSLRDYIILRAESEGADEVRFYLDEYDPNRVDRQRNAGAITTGASAREASESDDDGLWDDDDDFDGDEDSDDDE